jgi:hypothetical protein
MILIKNSIHQIFKALGKKNKNEILHSFFHFLIYAIYLYLDMLIKNS